MIKIIYFSGDSLSNEMSRKHNNLKLSCLSQGAVEVVAVMCSRVSCNP
jgi:hypothetical protein